MSNEQKDWEDELENATREELIDMCKHFQQVALNVYEKSEKRIKTLQSDNVNLLRACKMAYLKYYHDNPNFGWSETMNVLDDAIFNAISPEEYDEWVDLDFKSVETI